MIKIDTIFENYRIQKTIMLFLIFFLMSSSSVSSIYLWNNGKDYSSLFEAEDLMDSPWPMYCHDAHHTGRSTISTSETNGYELWRFKSEGRIEGGAITDQKSMIYVGDCSGHFYAIYPNGTIKWMVKLAFSIKSTPIIDQNGIIYVVTNGAYPRDYLYALYSSNGTNLWKYPTIDDVRSSPVLGNDNMIYFGDDNGYLYAVSTDGTLKWKYRISSAYYKAVSSSPAIGDDGTIYCGSTDGHLYALLPDGTLKWKFQLGDGYVRYSPSIGGDGTIYCALGGLFAINNDGTLKWKTNIGVSTTPAIGLDGTIYAGRSKLYALSPQNGQILWDFDPGSERKIVGGTPCICKDGIIYFGTHIDVASGGEIIAIDHEGKERWRHKIANDWVESPPCIGEAGIVYIGSTSTEEFEPGKWTTVGYLYAFGEGVNTPPYNLKFTGDTVGKINTMYSFQLFSDDDEGSAVYYNIDWGDNSAPSWIGPYSSGYTVMIQHNWSKVGDYLISIQAKDVFDAEAEGISHHITIEHNDPPEKPQISGRNRIKSGIYYTYSFVSTDPNNDDLIYFVDWGDGSDSGWIGQFPSGDIAKISHEWDKRGTYLIKAKVKDIYDAESSWATLQVTMPKTKWISPLERLLFKFQYLHYFL